jgi:putative membrane protein
MWEWLGQATSMRSSPPGLRQRGANPAVKQFAQMMIDHHTRTTQQVMESARSAGLTPPQPSLLPPQQTMLDQLRPLNGAAFEQMYLQQQRTAHRMALDLHQTYARNGDTVQLRQAASAAVPIVQSHIDQLGQLPAS